jgi:hypothetical protein
MTDSANVLVPELDACDTADATYLQERVWRRTRPNPTDANYNLPMALRLRGPLQLEALERAFNRVIERHEMLRTVFREDAGGLRQVILRRLTIRLVPDVASEMAQASYVPERLAAEANRPFSLEHGPLLRVGIIRVAPQEHVLWLTAHHIVSDGWSAQLLFAEVSALYAAFVDGSEPDLPAPYQFRDYARQHVAWLRSEAREKQLDYWRKTLRGADPVLRLPAPPAASTVEEGCDTHYSFALSGDVVAATVRTARAHRVTPFILMLTAFNVLLHRYTGRTDISVASWVAGRHQVEWERMIGLVRNAVILRNSLRADESCAALTGRVRDAVLDAHAHQDLPLEQVLADVAGPAAASWRERQIWFNGGRWRRLELAGIDVRAVRTAVRAPGRYLSVTVRHLVSGAGDRWEGDVEYNPALIDRALIAPIVTHFEHVLGQMCAEPARTVGDVGRGVPVPHS